MSTDDANTKTYDETNGEAARRASDGSTRSWEERRQHIKTEWAEAVEADDPGALDDWPVDRIAELEQAADLREQERDAVTKELDIVRRDLAVAQSKAEWRAKFIAKHAEINAKLTKLTQLRLFAVADTWICRVVVMIDGEPAPYILSTYHEYGPNEIELLEQLLVGFQNETELAGCTEYEMEEQLWDYEADELWSCCKCGKWFDHIEADGAVCEACK